MDAASLKREARRRRILENSENRLKKITGLTSNEVSSQHEGTSAGKISSSNEPLITSPNIDNVNIAEPFFSRTVESFMETPPAPENVPLIDDSLWKSMNDDRNDSSLLGQSTLLSQHPPSLILILCSKARLHIIALAVLVRALFFLQCGGIFCESAVAPFFTLELIELLNKKLRNKDTQPSSGLLSMAMMLSGMTPQKVSAILENFALFNQISQDLCIYLFIFSVTHVFVQLLWI